MNRTHEALRALVMCMLSVAMIVPMPSSAEAVEADASGYLGDGQVDPGEDEAAELARAVQNPIADLISVPFQNNTNFDFGPRQRTQNVLNIQPVVPIDVSDDWLLITRTILPIVSQPSLRPGQDRETDSIHMRCCACLSCACCRSSSS